MREWLSKKINYFKNRKVNLDSQKDTSENLILLKTLIENFNKLIEEFHSNLLSKQTILSIHKENSAKSLNKTTNNNLSNNVVNNGSLICKICSKNYKFERCLLKHIESCHKDNN